MSRSPTGAGGGLRTRVKTARGRKIGSTRWLERQLNDPYVKRAKAEGYRSRAAYKLIELDERFGFLKGAKRVVDLGVAPGGWAQVVRQRLPQAGLVEAAADFAVETLGEGGAFVSKVLAGGTDAELLALLKRHFRTVKHAKPPASRKGSSEWYVVAKGFKGSA